MLNFLSKFTIGLWVLIALIAGRSYIAGSTFAQAGATFDGGNIFKATNNTKQSPDYTDPLTNVDPGNVIQFSVDVLNNSTEVAHNTRVTVSAPGGEASTQVPSVTVSADNSNSVSDTVTLSGPLPFRFAGLVPNDSFLYTSSCPQGCPLGGDVTAGVNIGDVLPISQSNNVIVTFKLYTLPAVNPTPTPTPVITPTPTPTPTPVITPTPTPVITGGGR